jgi:phage baseplate assembly protein W
MAQGLSPTVPLAIDPRDGIKLNKEYMELVQQNLKMVILTSPGERIMDPYFGVGARRFLFEQDHPSVYADLSARIHIQVAKYLPYIELQEVDFQSQGTGYADIADNLVKIKIVFKVKPLNRTGTLILDCDGARP